MRRLPLFVVLCSLAAGCQSTPSNVDPHTQNLVEMLASENSDITRLSVHAIPEGGNELHAIASTSAEKRGTRSDPEDDRAVQSGETIVIDEGRGIDVTVPILRKKGAYTAAAGVTLKSDQDRDAAIATAKAIASKIEAAMRM